jgi:chromosome segregation ATPase
MLFQMAGDLQKECNSLHSQLRQTQVALQSVESELERMRYVESSLQQECHSLQRSLNVSHFYKFI